MKLIKKNNFALNLKETTPKEKLWSTYLEMSYDYISENWPEAIVGQTKDTFVISYEKILKRRVEEGPRKFFFLINNKTNEIIGLANIYLEHLLPSIIQLQIAEFYIIPKQRRVGNGKKFFYLILEWGKLNGATQIRIEVDKNLIKANHFWKSLGLEIDSLGSRNAYLGK